jgi:acyl-CoA synthetase (AMP-forming)/AMP-acid ligase II
MILFSSGSTGRPKGVVLKHRHLVATAENLATVYRLSPEHRELVLPPMVHSDGWQRVAATLFAGGCVVVPNEAPSPATIVELLPRLRISGFFMPPPLLRLVLRLQADVLRAAMRTLRSIEFGSAPLTAAELEHVLAELPDASVFVHYGLTECSRAVILDARARRDKLDTVGAAAPGVDIRVTDPDGRPLAAGEEGEIRLRGRQLTDRYWMLPELTREKLAGGWLRTGDYGRLDADGFLTLLGRRDDLITSAGYHFFPAEVETELGRVAGVTDYVIAGVPDPTGVLEQIPIAFAVPSDPQTWIPAAFIAVARQRLPSHMVPRRVVSVASLPLTPSGKPDRRRAVELYGRR